MIVLTSPAKTLDWQTPYPDIVNPTQPLFSKQAAQIHRILKQKTAHQISELMGISNNLGTLNYQRYHQWTSTHTCANSRPALYAYKGDIFTQLELSTYNKSQLEYAQAHLMVISGLYGLVRAWDLIQPYRLEMKIKLPELGNMTLAQHWNKTITHFLKSRHPDLPIVNLASEEYAQAVDFKQLNQVIHIAFKEFRDGRYQTIGILAKKARGIMINYAIKNLITDPQNLKQFNQQGYAYRQDISTADTWTFVRQ